MRGAGCGGLVAPFHRDNRGLVASLNELASHARAPIIARMDGDDVSFPNRFQKQLAFWTRNPEYGVIGTWCKDVTEVGNPTGRAIASQPTDHEAFLAAVLQRQPLIAHPTVMMHRHLLEKVGGYRAMFRHCEDYDLWLRLSAHTKLCSMPEHLYAYRYYPGQVSQRHIVEQLYGACVAFLAWQIRERGESDPTESLHALPDIETLDAMFGEGSSQFASDWVAGAILYSESALKSDGFEFLLRNIRSGGNRDGLWRTAGRLVKLGQPARGAKLALALMTR
ncbi:MAG: glycosyltransferase [Parasphingorhabdus sp.]|nr:glycosyltransferase [Parasphingorhabdus sp.]